MLLQQEFPIWTSLFLFQFFVPQIFTGYCNSKVQCKVLLKLDIWNNLLPSSLQSLQVNSTASKSSRFRYRNICTVKSGSLKENIFTSVSPIITKSKHLYLIVLVLETCIKSVRVLLWNECQVCLLILWVTSMSSSIFNIFHFHSFQNL